MPYFTDAWNVSNGHHFSWHSMNVYGDLGGSKRSVRNVREGAWSPDPHFTVAKGSSRSVPPPRVSGINPGSCHTGLLSVKCIEPSSGSLGQRVTRTPLGSMVQALSRHPVCSRVVTILGFVARGVSAHTTQMGAHSHPQERLLTWTGRELGGAVGPWPRQ